MLSATRWSLLCFPPPPIPLALFLRSRSTYEVPFKYTPMSPGQTVGLKKREAKALGCHYQESSAHHFFASSGPPRSVSYPRLRVVRSVAAWGRPPGLPVNRASGPNFFPGGYPDLSFKPIKSQVFHSRYLYRQSKKLSPSQFQAVSDSFRLFQAFSGGRGTRVHLRKNTPFPEENTLEHAKTHHPPGEPLIQAYEPLPRHQRLLV